MIADVAVSNDKVSIELLPTRDAEAANEDGDEKVNLAMAFQRVQVKGESYFLNNRRFHLSEKNRKVKTKSIFLYARILRLFLLPISKGTFS